MSLAASSRRQRRIRKSPSDGDQSIRWRRTKFGINASGWNSRDNPTFLHDVGAVAQRENGVEILFHEQDRRAELPTEGAKGGADQLDDRRLNAFRRFVEQHQSWIADERAADRKLLLFSAGHGSGHLIAPLLKAREGFEDEFGQLLAAGSTDQAPDFEILLHRHSRKDVTSLRDIAHPEPRAILGWKAGDIAPQELDFTGGRTEQADEATHGCCLSNAVAANQADDLSFIHREVDALKDGSRAVASPQTRDFEKSVSAHGRSCPGRFQPREDR